MKRCWMVALWAAFPVVAGATSPPAFDYAPPKITMQQAIEQATSCLKKKSVNVNEHFLQSATFDRTANRGGWQAREWRVKWQLKQIAKGGDIYVLLNDAGECTVTYGE